jgi:hypothetical protein
MKYTAMDRKIIADLLEKDLQLEKWRAEKRIEAFKWGFNYQEKLKNTNLKRIENFADEGVLHTYSADYLYNYVDPESELYTGLAPEELNFYLRISYEKARQRELQETRTKQLIQNTLEEMQARRAKEARAWEEMKLKRSREARAWAKEMRERELFLLRKERLEKLIEKGDEDKLDPETY